MKPKRWLEIVGTAILIEILLILISIAEVFIWGFTQSGPPTDATAQAHAEAVGPFLSAIFGALLMYAAAWNFCRRDTEHRYLYAIALPTIYLLLDVAILLFYPVDWLHHFPVLLAANAPKFAGSLFATFLAERKGRRETSS